MSPDVIEILAAICALVIVVGLLVWMWHSARDDDGEDGRYW